MRMDFTNTTINNAIKRVAGPYNVQNITNIIMATILNIAYTHIYI